MDAPRKAARDGVERFGGRTQGLGGGRVQQQERRDHEREETGFHERAFLNEDGGVL
jgi:hypothetical protein